MFGSFPRPTTGRTAVLVLLATSLWLPTPAAARVSLGSIDAKLDNIIAGLGAQGGGSVEFVNVRQVRLTATDGDGQRSVHTMFTVPAGKILVVDHVTILLDVVVGNRPENLRMEAQVRGMNPQTPGLVILPLGYMEELVSTSRGTPNFLMSRNISTYFGEGDVECVGESNFGGVNLTFGLIECTLSGRLIDAPGP